MDIYYFLKVFSEEFILKMKLAFHHWLRYNGEAENHQTLACLSSPLMVHLVTLPSPYSLPGCAYVSLYIFSRKLCLGCMQICVCMQGEEQKTYYRQGCQEVDSYRFPKSQLLNL